MFRPRLLSDRLKTLFSNFPCVALLGARQVGKSTLIQHMMPDASYVVFDPMIDIENARSQPDLFLKMHRTPLLLDEIQFVPELVSSLKRKIDENRQNGLYLLTGSQQWQIMNRLSDSLAGRVGILELSGFSLSEFADTPLPERSWLERWLNNPTDFSSTEINFGKFSRNLYEILWAGLLPQACEIDLTVIPDFHRSYLNTYIERDIRQLGDIGDWQNFSRFVQLLGALTAQEVNFSHLGREIGINPMTARRWLSLISGTYQWFMIPAFSQNAVKRVAHKPKGYLTDTGAACFAQRISSPEALGGHPLLGALFETLMVTEIRKLMGQMSTPPTLYHWRSGSGAEVDLILEWNQKFYPIEIKLNSHPSAYDTRGITAFRNTYPHLNIEKGLIIAPCDRFHALSERDFALPWHVI